MRGDLLLGTLWGRACDLTIDPGRGGGGGGGGGAIRLQNEGPNISDLTPTGNPVHFQTVEIDMNAADLFGNQITVGGERVELLTTDSTGKSEVPIV